MSKWPIFQPQDSAADLYNHARRMVLVQNPAGLVYPALCPYCGNIAAQSILGKSRIAG